MSSLRADFDELRERIRYGRELGHASFEPVYYLVFSPSEIIQVKRQTPAWLSKLKQDGWEISTVSMADEIWSVLKESPLWPLCLAQDKKEPLNWVRTNQALADMLISNDVLLKRLEAHLEPLEGKKNALLFVTDLEALHPFVRIGTIEGKLIGKFHVPTVFLYPGERAGKTGLRFLGFYPEDGNYRSVHVGG